MENQKIVFILIFFCMRFPLCFLSLLSFNVTVQGGML